MKLEKIIVKNFGLYREQRQFELSNDLTVFYGANFSGKSTLAKAIYLALTGKAHCRQAYFNSFHKIQLPSNDNNSSIGVPCFSRFSRRRCCLTFLTS